MPRYLIKRLRISLFAVAVNPRTGVQLFNKERNSEMRPKASRKAAFPFFPIPLKEKKPVNQSKTNTLNLHNLTWFSRLKNASLIHGYSNCIFMQHYFFMLCSQY